jgi:hypothetical protein
MRITSGRFISPVLAVLGQTPVLTHAAEKVNVLLIISDDLRPERELSTLVQNYGAGAHAGAAASPRA